MPAIDAMLQKSPCLLPNCIDTELYRGHPLLFYFLASFWGKLISSSLSSLHAFPLLVSVLTILSLYRVSKMFFDEKYALFTAMLLMVQVVFVVQATFLLPEILITLLTLETFYAYHKKKYIYYFFIGALLGLTKESGMVILGVFLLFHLINCVKERKYSPLNYIWIGLPLLPIGAFFLYQKYLLGWFFFPLHTGMIDLSWGSFKIKADIILSFLFLEQGRWVLWVLLSVVFACKVLYSKSIKFKVSFSKEEYQLLLFSTLIFVVYVIFSATNFLMLRYLLCLLPFVLLLFSLMLSKILSINNKGFLIVYLLIPFFIWTNYQNMFKLWIDDASMNAFDMIKVHQKVVTFIEGQGWFDKHIDTHFLMWHNLTKPPLGYLSSSQIFENVVYDSSITSDIEVVIISRIEIKDDKYEKIKNDSSLRLVKRIESNKAWSEIFFRQ